MTTIKRATTLLILLLSASIALAGSITIHGNTQSQSFNKAKKILLKEIYADQHETFYCRSEFDQSKSITHTNGYQPQKKGKRAYRLEWEHIVPAHAFGQSFPAWRNGNPSCIDSKGKSFKGRRCAGKVSIEYRYMQADMHNLVPAIGELNGRRSNYSFAMLTGESREFGTCDMEIRDRKAEPPPEVRGDIARTYFYMDAAYPNRGIISKKNRKLFEAWDRQDPIDAWERERSQRVEAIQGNANPFVE
ncbi:MAG: endonuclease [Deltaproteobacteria bacterium]|nr:endonuclease [Deltaproteobacteria bacterium]